VKPEGIEYDVFVPMPPKREVIITVHVTKVVKAEPDRIEDGR
jgi:hypothetical protein